ncbi:MAG: sigma-70 family RNA polymerase sigma factor [Pacificimonas sp.]|jgi:RNA polymerase sigma-70 factor (ECF subfamily)|nr:sigma-70 family RNA polymerase sigma factor [Pacificimonas sp.]
MPPTTTLSFAPPRASLPLLGERDVADRALSDWETWFVAGQAGDKVAYRRFLGAAEGHLKRYFYGKAGSEGDDLVQEVLIALHTKRASYDPRYPLIPWMNTIARYKWIDWLRKRSRTQADELPEQIEDTSSPAQPAAGHAVALLLKRLPEKQAEAIRLVKLEGLTVAEASQSSGQSESLIKVNVHRGLKTLNKFVDDDPQEARA